MIQELLLPFRHCAIDGLSAFFEKFFRKDPKILSTGIAEPELKRAKFCMLSTAWYEANCSLIKVYEMALNLPYFIPSIFLAPASEKFTPRNVTKLLWPSFNMRIWKQPNTSGLGCEKAFQ